MIIVINYIFFTKNIKTDNKQKKLEIIVMITAA